MHRRKLLQRISLAAALALLVPAVLLYRLRRAPVDRRTASIAVLPLSGAGGDLDAESLGDGIAEGVNSLSRLPNLKVMSYSAVLRFKGQKLDAQDVGRRLKVETVLAGRVVRRAENFSIRVEMVRVDDGSQLWGEQYDRKVADIFAIQEEIGSRISEFLRLRLSGEERKSLTRRDTENPEAYQECVKGRYFWNKRSAEGLKMAMAHFEEAIAKDPSYAQAYAGLADCYVLFPLYAMVPPRDNYDRASAAAGKALEMDASVAEAYAALGLVKSDRDYDWAGAERDFKKALALNPGYATAHHYYAEFLFGQRRFEEALVEAKRAQELDPLSPIICVTFGQIFLSMRRYDEAIEQHRNALSLEPNFGFGHNNLGVVYIEKSMYSEAIAELKAALRIASSPITVAHLARAYVRSGNRAEAKKILEDLLARAQRSYQRALPVALAYMAVGDHDRAFQWLGRAVDESGPGIKALNVYPYYDPLRSDPRFTELLHRMHLVR